MEVKERKQLKKGRSFLLGACFVLLGAVCGVIMIKCIDYAFGEKLSFGETLFYLAIAFIEMFVIIYLQVIIHEAGHLVAGILSGYTFSSFRIGNFMWVKEKEKVHLRRLSLEGTGGQCLMNPPDMVDGKLPFVFYNLGGVLMNLATIPICIVGFICFQRSPLASIFFLIMCVVGFTYALINGIPMKLGIVNNDGCNVKELGKSEEALRSFWVQMKVAEQLTKGVRLKDMPSEWFFLPEESELQNGITAVMAVFYENRLMDEHAFTEVEALIDRLLSIETGIVGLHQNLLICDRIYCELIRGGDHEIIDRLYSKNQMKFMKQMQKFPTVIRTDYAYTLLYKKDVEKAKQTKDLFEKYAKQYPYPSDIESERELMDWTDKISYTIAIIE